MRMLAKVMIMIFAMSSSALYANEECDLKKQNAFKHTIVEEDLNKDGIKDIFYLVGEEDQFLTCIFLGKKTKSKVEYELKHMDSESYNPILNFLGQPNPQILVSTKRTVCHENGVDGEEDNYIPENMKPEIRENYEKWSKAYEKYNYKYGMPEMEPIYNLQLLQDVKIFEFQGDRKVDVTRKAKDYLALKKRVLTETLKSKQMSKDCRRKLEANLKSIPQAI